MMLFPGIASIMQQIEFSGRNSFPGISMNLILRKGILKLFFVCHCISINTVFPVVVGVCFHRCIGVQHSPHTNSISAILHNNYISLLSDLCACVHVNKNGVVKEAIVLQWAVRIASWLRTWKKAMGWCTAQWKMLLFCAKTIMKESRKFELAHLKKKKKKKKKKEKHFGRLATFWFGAFAMLFSATGRVVHHENTRRWTVGRYSGL